MYIYTCFLCMYVHMPKITTTIHKVRQRQSERDREREREKERERETDRDRHTQNESKRGWQPNSTQWISDGNLPSFYNSQPGNDIAHFNSHTGARVVAQKSHTPDLIQIPAVDLQDLPALSIPKLQR